MLAVRRLGTVTDGSVWRAVHTVRFQEGWRAKHDGARVDHPTKHDNARVDHVTSAAPTRTRTPNEIRNVAWSREEEAVLRELIGKKMDKRSIAEAVGRSHNAVVNRLWVLRRDGQELVRRRRWTPAEHHHMLDLYAVNFPPVLIAARLNRTIRSIYCRILKLRQTKTPFKPKFKSPAITPSDKETMLSLRDAGWTADRVCAEHFPQYTVSSVRHACNYYRSYRHTGKERSFHKWSEEEVKQLVELRREKVRWKVVAATLQCGIAACRAKYYRVMTSHAGVDDAKRGVSPSPALAGGEKEGKEEGEQKQKQKQRRGDEMAQLGVEGRKERPCAVTQSPNTAGFISMEEMEESPQPWTHQPGCANNKTRIAPAVTLVVCQLGTSESFLPATLPPGSASAVPIPAAWTILFVVGGFGMDGHLNPRTPESRFPIKDIPIRMEDVTASQPNMAVLPAQERCRVRPRRISADTSDILVNQHSKLVSRRQICGVAKCIRGSATRNPKSMGIPGEHEGQDQIHVWWRVIP